MTDLRPGDVVVIRAFDDIPEHRFRIAYVFDDCYGGHSLDGPLAGEYGEPDHTLIAGKLQFPARD